jgi:sirohydrochlorin cobaltochelatase
VSEPTLEQLLEAELAGGQFAMGEVFVRPLGDGGAELTHRGADMRAIQEFAPENALEIAKFDDTGKYRPLRTAPGLRHGWKIIARDTAAIIEVLDAIYPARLAAWRAWKLRRLMTTPLRATLNRQSGMYRIAAKISDQALDTLVGDFCRSDGGCLRTILWRRDETDTVASTMLPPAKFDPAHDQTGRDEPCIPLLCQEACSLLVSACREAVTSER